MIEKIFNRKEIKMKIMSIISIVALIVLFFTLTFYIVEIILLEKRLKELDKKFNDHSKKIKDKTWM